MDVAYKYDRDFCQRTCFRSNNRYVNKYKLHNYLYIARTSKKG